jgi:hypothetical protein
MNTHCARRSSPAGSASPTRHTPDASSGTYSPPLPEAFPSGAGRTVVREGRSGRSSRNATGRGFGSGLFS